MHFISKVHLGIDIQSCLIALPKALPTTFQRDFFEIYISKRKNQKKSISILICRAGVKIQIYDLPINFKNSFKK